MGRAGGGLSASNKVLCVLSENDPWAPQHARGGGDHQQSRRRKNEGASCAVGGVVSFCTVKDRIVGNRQQQTSGKPAALSLSPY